MMQIKQSFAIALLILGSVLTGCSERGDRRTLAQVGDYRISIADLKTFEQKLPKSFQVGQKGGGERVRENLQTLIDKRLMVLEAKAQGLDRDPDVVEAVKKAVGHRLVEDLERHELDPKITVSPEEIKEEYRRGGWEFMVESSEIFLKKEHDAEEAAEEIRGGRTFDDVAKERSVHPLLGIKTGPIPNTYFRHDQPGNVVNELFTMEVGQVEGPIAMPGGLGYLIVKLVAKKPVTVEQVQDRITEVLKNQKRKTLREEYLKRLRDAYHVQLNPAGMDLLVRKVNATGEEATFSADERKEPIYRYDGGAITIEMCLPAVVRLKKETSPVSKEQIAGLMRDRLLPQALMEREARRLNLDKQVSAWIEAKREDFLVKQLRSRIITDVAVTDADRRAYYATHKDEFRRPAQADIVEVLVSDKTEATDLLNQVRRGADIAEVARRKSIRREGSRFHVHPFETNRYGKEMVEKVFTAKIGEVCGPIQTNGGYSVFTVLSRQEEGLRPFEDVRSLINGRVFQEKERRQFEAFLQNLRAQHRHRITIFEEPLKQVAAQDTLATRT
jgi:parvulin-like peptidyl-prolyl isomerase